MKHRRLFLLLILAYPPRTLRHLRSPRRLRRLQALQPRRFLNHRRCFRLRHHFPHRRLRRRQSR